MTPLITDPLATDAPAPSSSAAPKDVTAQNFMADVLEPSKQALVFVLFHSPRSKMSHQLEAQLSRLLGKVSDKVRFTRVDIDSAPDIAQQLRVQSVPTLYVFFHGQPVDGFEGSQDDAHMKKWLKALFEKVGMQAPSLEDYGPALKQAAEILAAGDSEKAMAIYADIFNEDASNPEALAGMMQCLLHQGELDQVQEMMDALDEDMLSNKAMDSVRAALQLAEKTQNVGNLADMEAAVEKNPDDHQARFDLAMAYYGAGKREQAVDQLLESIARDRSWNEQAARKQLVEFFEAFGHTDPLTLEARRRLSSILFS